MRAFKGLRQLYRYLYCRKLGATFKNITIFTIFGSAAELEFDKQGRILVPSALREHAELQKDAVIIGTGDKVEIWSRERFDAYDAEVAESVESLAEGLEGIIL